MISQLRRQNISDHIDLKELASEIAGIKWKGNVCDCPFHDSVSKTSMKYYHNDNHLHCFGCPSHQNHFDAVWFVAKFNNWNISRAIKWLEVTYNIKRLKEVSQNDEVDDEEEAEYLTFAVVSDIFIKWMNEQNFDTDKRLRLRKIYWDANNDMLVLANIIGKTTLFKMLEESGYEIN